MTRRDFILLAAALRNARPMLPFSPPGGALRAQGAMEAWENTARRIAEAIESKSPNFDRARFLAACGVED